MENDKLGAIRLLLDKFPVLKTWLSITTDTLYLAYAVNEVDAWKKNLKNVLDDAEHNSQYVVITIFRGKFDEIMVFSTESFADAYIAVLKADFSDDDDEFEIVKHIV